VTGGQTARAANGVFNPVIAAITLRATMSRRRALLFAIPAVILVGVSVLLRLTARDSSWPSDFLGTFGFSVVLPLTSLIIGTSVLGAEMDDGSVLHLLATPVRRSAVVLSKFCVSVALTVAFAAVPELIAGLIATGGASRLAAGLFAGALAAAVIYNAIFVMVSVLTSRAIVAGLLYLLVWEGLLANLVSGASELSVGQYSLAIAGAISHSGDLNVHLSLLTAVFMGAIVTVAALLVAIRALSGFSLKGDAV
jgi:ABC-2 type transport system permease protein